MTQSNLSKDYSDIKFEVMVDPDNTAIYVKFLGIDNLKDAEEYADYLVERLPLMLFESDVIH